MTDRFLCSGVFTLVDTGKPITLTRHYRWYVRLWRWFRYVVLKRPKLNLGSCIER